MNKTIRIGIAVLIIGIIGSGLVYLGTMLGRSGWTAWGGQFNSYSMPMFSRFDQGNWNRSNNFNPHMMGGTRMMGDYYFNSGSDITPLTSEEVDSIVHEFLEESANEDLILGEIMIFDNHAYAQIVEKSTGIGAMEVLIDPLSKSVSPEHGPNMIWNLKYSPMVSSNRFHQPGLMMGSGMDWFEESVMSSEVQKEMSVSEDQAVDTAQNYLDQYYPGTQADEHADPFYGYYTIHVLRDGEVTGMLSVNGYSSQVFFHNWHGEFIQMSDH